MRQVVICVGLIFLLCCRHSDSTPDPAPNVKPCGCPFLSEPLNYSINQSPDSLTSYYLAVWKRQFLQRNKLSESSFQQYITAISPSLLTWYQGVSFRVDYVYQQSWLRLRYSESFQVKFDPVTTASLAISAPRGMFLNESQIPFNNMIAAQNFEPLRIGQPLAFATCESACELVRKKTGHAALNPQYVSFYVPGRVTRVPGDPFLFSSGVLNQAKNRCLFTSINLVTGEVTAQEDVCYIEG